MTEETKVARGNRKTRVGTVISAKQQKTIVVRVDRRAAHPLYRKTVSSDKRYYVHDENGEARVGDKVEIMETRPLSKMKRWRLVTIIQRTATE